MPSRLLQEAEQRLPPGVQQNDRDVFLLMKAHISGDTLCQPALLIQPGRGVLPQIEAFLNALQTHRGFVLFHFQHNTCNVWFHVIFQIVYSKTPQTKSHMRSDKSSACRTTGGCGFWAVGELDRSGKIFGHVPAISSCCTIHARTSRCGAKALEPSAPLRIYCCWIARCSPQQSTVASRAAYAEPWNSQNGCLLLEPRLTPHPNSTILNSALQTQTL